MATTPRVIRSKYTAIEKQLATQREALLSRFAAKRSDLNVEFEPDDICGEANRDLARHLLLATLDRDQRTLSEIEVALKKLKAGEYGVCEACGQNIAVARLNALPWARLCIHCADRTSRLDPS